MALASPAKHVTVSAALTALQPPGPDQYCIAFGPGAAQFCATPNGYSTTQLPRKVVNDILGGQIKKVLHASFGSDANSFFFTYEMRDGSVAHRVGRAIPPVLRAFVDHISNKSEELASSLRIQLGANGAYVAWAGSLWMCRGIPHDLRLFLRNLSSTDFDNANGSQGLLKSGTLDNVAWHDSGSYYIRIGTTHKYCFETATVQQAWKNLWHCGSGLERLAYVAINPHFPTGNTFAFFKKTQPGQDSDFILRFEPEEVMFRLQSGLAPEHITRHEGSGTDDSTFEVDPQKYSQVITTPKNAEGLQVFQWGISKRTGRSHKTDSWELELKKGERVKILKYMGKDWFLAENRRRQKGWVHRAWLDFQEMIPHVDPREVYARFTADIEKLLKAGNIRSFPNLPSYINACVKDACSPLKKSTHRLGICVHDLHELMRGSGEYTLETLKMERNKWHPDKFSRYCHPNHRDVLREKAQALFVLFGVLMDILENSPASE